MAASTVKVHVTNVETVVPDNAYIYSRTDLKGRIVEVNEVFAAISGYSVDEMLGKPHNLVRHPDIPREVFADMWKSLKGRRPWQGVVKNRRSDGGYYWVIANASPVYEEGNIVGYQSIRSKPTKAQIQVADEVYRRIREGDRSLKIVNGHVVSRSSVWMDRALGFTVELRSCLALSIVTALVGFLALKLGAAPPFLRPLSETLFVLNIGAAVLAFFHADRRLHQDLDKISDHLEHILTSGDLKTRLELQREDRLGSIARKLSLLTSWIQTAIFSIGDAAAQVQDGTESVFEGILEIDKAAITQNQSTSSVAAAAAELDLTIQQVAEHLRNTEKTVGETGRQAKEGGDISLRAANQIDGLAQAIQCASAEVEALSNSSAEVGQIAGVIKEIADQTNLLALNASIEAARAGEGGRGFAVVANEVRQLADRTMKATANIDSLILKIRGDSERAIQSMHSGRAQVLESVTMVQAAREALDGINSLMRDAVSRVSQIAASSSQQTEAMNDITRNITQVASMTDQNTQTVHRTTILMKELDPLVVRVRKAVALYKV